MPFRIPGTGRGRSDFVMEDGDNLFVRDAEVTHGDGGV